MSEFLARGWNTCTPDVDVGDDVLVLEDRKGQFKRVQVKTASAAERKDGYSVQFNIPIKQLRQSIAPEIHYVFMVRRDYKWVKTLIIRRDVLNSLYEVSNIGNVIKNKTLLLYISFKNNEIKCKEVDLSSFLDNFSEFPDISH